jgi:hypothetical protein
MKIRIERNINNGKYAHYPSQILVDHPDEKKLIDEGYAVPVREEPETAKLSKGETRKAK